MDQPDQTDVVSRLRLIEEMMAEGRRTTERWGWAFLLWGIGPVIAMLWESRWPHGAWAWPMVVVLCVVLNGAALRNVTFGAWLAWRERSHGNE